MAAAETLKERGAYKIFVMATHGILSCDAPRFIEESAIDEVRVYFLVFSPAAILKSHLSHLLSLSLINFLSSPRWW